MCYPLYTHCVLVNVKVDYYDFKVKIEGRLLTMYYYLNKFGVRLQLMVIGRRPKV